MADLFKAREVNEKKLKKISEISDEGVVVI